ncbi:type II toxin-antitoxin system VapC family toxin [Lichenicoccus sp.]|uniref:type II toxin-antitoxin system VapC family toxin n=1 Tax=Lichenicoccus sp. TaxID=2781899 RepID=UPI003D0A6D9E
MYLVDTDVLSAGAPTKAVASPALSAWMDRNSLGLYLSVITVAELEDGIAKSRRLGATRKADRLAEWLQTLLHLYGARVLPVDLDVARLTGALADRARAAGQAPGFADLAIAGTAEARGYTILTRNLRHFGRLGVPALDPFETVPAPIACGTPRLTG